MKSNNSSNPSKSSKLRDWISIIIIVFSFLFILILAIYLLRDGSDDYIEMVFNTIIPLLATWVGTVLAFYYGKSNFEAAADKYKEIVDRLSPDVLGQLKVEQIMILKKTMITKPVSWATGTGMNMGKIKDYLEKVVEKSRLPLLEDEKVKYILHDDLLKPDQSEALFVDFIKKEGNKKPFITVRGSETVEAVTMKMAQIKGCEDAFVLDAEGKVEGWITNSLISRYLQSKK